MATTSSEKLSISLPLEMADELRKEAGSGEFSSLSEMVRMGMRDWFDRKRQLAHFDKLIARSERHFSKRRYRSGSEVKKELGL
jgi:Arc/MetJ-type ribon-helix-helix transcriptional regulator